MTEIKRYQRKRHKGWTKPDGAVIVDRTSKWGNPFRLEGDMIYCDASHRRRIFNAWVVFDGENLYGVKEGRQKCIELYEQWIKKQLPEWAYEGYGGY